MGLRRGLGKLWKRLWFRVLAIVAVVVLAFVALFAVAYLVADYRATRELEQEMEKVRESGAPLTLDDLMDEWYVTDASGKRRLRTPDSENAALVYQQAFDLLEAEVNEEEFALIRDLLQTDDPSEWPEEDAARLKSILEKTSGALELAQQASEMAQCQFELEFWKGFEMLLPHYNGLRRVHGLFLAQALLGLRQGRSKEALESCRIALRVSSAVRHEPTLMAVMFRHGFLIVAQKVVHLAATALPPAVEKCKDLLAEVQQQEIDLRRHLQVALEGERAFGLFLYAQLLKGSRVLADLIGMMVTVTPTGFEEGPEHEPFASRLFRSRVGRPVVRRDAAEYLRHMQEVVDVSSQSLPKALKEARIVECQFQPLRNLPVVYIPHYVSLILTSGIQFDKCLGNLAVAIGRCRVTEVGLALEIYKAREGDYPESLEALVPEFFSVLPDDPFTGAPLKYQRDSAELLVYSVGPNGKDEGGADGPTPNEREDELKDDMTWRVRRRR